MMKKILILSVICIACVALYADDVRRPSYLLEDNSFFDPTKKKAAEAYHFGMEYRVEVAYVQKDHRTKGTYPGIYLHGARVGATFHFLLPIHFSLQTGLLYTLTYGKDAQHWRSGPNEDPQVEYIQHRVLQHQLTIPVRMYYTVPLWRQLNLFFYTGPQLHIGLAAKDRLTSYLSDETRAWVEEQGVATEPYDLYTSEQCRANIQWGLGAGIEWDRYRFQGGYDFGLNNLINYTDIYRFMNEWEWQIGFCVRLN